jgi:E3 ubiquitin-protein ligase SHPRH
VCLSGFDGDRAVLRCGHSFHYSPCLEQLQSRSGSSVITCPLRCKLRTTAQEVMIASEKRRDDGSRIKRQVKGSWGTKVTRLVADVLDVCDLGEKSIVFSQWEDMLNIAEQALATNGVNFVRATSLKRIGECIKHFRSQDCSVLLLNIKNGAEGLTILEATHVFMIEPLLNCGLDSQGT